MRSPARARRSGRVTACVVGAVAAVAAILASGRGGPSCDADGAGGRGTACLVMTGSGDPAFTRNFNPFTGSC